MGASARDAQVARRTALSCGQVLCLLAILFATGDVWPAIDIGVTVRLSQALLLGAAALLPIALLSDGVRLFPGWCPVAGFVAWIVLTLPLSSFVERTLPFAIWAFTDALILFVFVQYFRTEADLRRLVSCFLGSFVVLSLFGVLQFVLALFGIDLLVAQWIVEGRLARVNGLSFEPSYYSTYMLVGWAASLYLLEKRAPFPSRRLQLACALSSTTALVLCTSKLGWGFMLGYAAIRLLRQGVLILMRAKIRLRTAALLSALPLAAALLTAAVLAGMQRFATTLAAMSILLAGLGVAGQPAHSVMPRIHWTERTWDVFLSHPVTGSGIGAVAKDIAVEYGGLVESVEDGKKFDGLNVSAELLASTGIVGGALASAFAVTVMAAARRRAAQPPAWNRPVLGALSWGIMLMMLALQLNANFLRVPIYVDLGVLLCCLSVRPGWRPLAQLKGAGAAVLQAP